MAVDYAQGWGSVRLDPRTATEVATTAQWQAGCIRTFLRRSVPNDQPSQASGLEGYVRGQGRSSRLQTDTESTAVEGSPDHEPQAADNVGLCQHGEHHTTYMLF